MKLGEWVQAWRQGPDEEPRPRGTSTDSQPAVTASAVATLRAALAALEESAASPAALAEQDARPSMEALLVTLKESAVKLGVPHLEHAAGQMRVLLRCVQDGTLEWDATVGAAMHDCLTFLLRHVMKGSRLPRQPAEMARWNDTYQSVMARLAPRSGTAPPEAAPAPPAEPDAATQLPELPAREDNGDPHVADRLESLLRSNPALDPIAPEPAPEPEAPVSAPVLSGPEPPPAPAAAPLPLEPAARPTATAAPPPLPLTMTTPSDLPPLRRLGAPLRGEELDLDELERQLRAGCTHGAVNPPPA